MQVKFYNIDDEKKKINKSLGTAKITVDGVLLAGSTLSSPTIRLSLTQENLVGINYAYIADMSRYYYITNMEFMGNNVWIVSLKVDVLKSFASNIHSSSAYIARTSNETHINEHISDSKFPVEVESTILSEVGTSKTTGNHWRSSDMAFTAGNDTEHNEYHYVIAIKGAYEQMDDSSLEVSTTGTFYIACNTPGLFKFWNSMSQSKIDITKYVVDVFWLPFEIPRNTSKYITKIWCNEVIGTNINDGYYYIGTGMDIIDPGTNSLYPVSRLTYDYEFEVEIPNDLATYEYLKYRPFSEISMCFLPFGTFPLDRAFIENAGNNYVRFLVKTNILSGSATLYYHVGTSTALKDLRYLASATLKISSIISGSGGTGQFVTSAVSAIGSATTGASAGAVAGGIPGAVLGGAIGAISSFAMSGMNFDNHKLIVSGSPNGRVELVPMVFITSYRTVETVSAVNFIGKPCAKVLTLSVGSSGNFSVGDFVMCDDVHLDGTGMLSEEYNEVENWLKSGVYL